MSWLLLIVVGTVLLIVWLRRRDRIGGAPSHTMPNTAASAPKSVEELLAAGRKIEAIKLYRREHGAGLREAKEAVEAMAQGMPK